MTHLEYLKKHLRKKDMYAYPKMISSYNEKGETIYYSPIDRRNPYVEVAKVFDELNNSSDITILVKGFEEYKSFYDWLINFKKGDEEYFVLNLLLDKEFDDNFEEFKKFIFYPYSKGKHFISQKWHFYISWYALRNFYGVKGYNYKTAITNDEWENELDYDFENGQYIKDGKIEKRKYNYELVQWLKSFK